MQTARSHVLMQQPRLGRYRLKRRNINQLWWSSEVSFVVSIHLLKSLQYFFFSQFNGRQNTIASNGIGLTLWRPDESPNERVPKENRVIVAWSQLLVLEIIVAPD